MNAVLAGLYRSRQTVPYIKQTTGIQNLDLKAFLDVHVPVPPVAVQASLAQRLRADWRRLDDLVTSMRAQQQLLAERREALITAAVTGQVDPTTVRSN